MGCGERSKKYIYSEKKYFHPIGVAEYKIGLGQNQKIVRCRIYKMLTILLLQTYLFAYTTPIFYSFVLW